MKLVKVFQDFFDKGIVNKCTYEPYICLIPKKDASSWISFIFVILDVYYV